MDALKDYEGNLLLAGISYDRKTKTHLYDRKDAKKKIKDKFFEDMADPYLKGNKAGNRPH